MLDMLDIYYDFFQLCRVDSYSKQLPLSWHQQMTKTSGFSLVSKFPETWNQKKKATKRTTNLLQLVSQGPNPADKFPGNRTWVSSFQGFGSFSA